MQWLCRISYPTWCCISMPAPKLLLLSGLTLYALRQQSVVLSLIGWQRQTMQSDPRQVPTPACAHAKTLMLVVASRRRACWTKAHCGSTSFSRTAWQTSGMPEHLWPEKYKNLSNATGCDYMSMSHTSADLDESAAGSSYCGAFVAAPEQYCARTVNLQSFSEVNR